MGKSHIGVLSRVPEEVPDQHYLPEMHMSKSSDDSSPSLWAGPVEAQWNRNFYIHKSHLNCTKLSKINDDLVLSYKVLR